MQYYGSVSNPNDDTLNRNEFEALIGESLEDMGLEEEWEELECENDND